MTPVRKAEPPLPAIQDPSLCHYCHKNKLDPKNKYFLPNGIQVCRNCAAEHGRGTSSRPAKKVKRT
jgi:hypothetical protein